MGDGLLQQTHVLELEQVDAYECEAAQDAKHADDDSREGKAKAWRCLLARHNAQYDGDDAGDNAQNPADIAAEDGSCYGKDERSDGKAGLAGAGLGGSFCGLGSSSSKASWMLCLISSWDMRASVHIVGALRANDARKA